MERFLRKTRMIHDEQHNAIKELSYKGMIVFSLISLGGYFLLDFEVLRTDTVPLYIVFAVLFFLYGWILEFNFSKNRLYFLLIAALCFRAVSFFALPHLSDDYFRFIWDGRLSANGINPFNALPSHFVQTREAVSAGVNSSIYHGLNSKGYYTIYPPVMQGIFWLAAKVYPHNIIGSIFIMRLFIFAAEGGSLFLLHRLLILFKKNESFVLLYAWNPLVVVELTGNLHFEAVMIFFLLLAVYLLIQRKTGWSALVFGMAIATKLLPLMLLPALFRRIGWKKTIGYGMVAAGVTVLLFLPFMDAVFLKNITSSIGLYFKKFEFNASLFYIIRWLGFQVKGYDIIHAVTQWLFLIALISIFIYTWKEKRPDMRNICTAWMWIWIFYLACSTIVHPWYVAPLVAFAVFTNYRFPIVWSGVIILSYFTYHQVPFHESMALVALEYGVVVAAMLWELNRGKVIGNQLHNSNW